MRMHATDWQDNRLAKRYFARLVGLHGGWDVASDPDVKRMILRVLEREDIVERITRQVESYGQVEYVQIQVSMAEVNRARVLDLKESALMLVQIGRKVGFVDTDLLVRTLAANNPNIELCAHFVIDESLGAREARVSALVFSGERED